MVVRAALLIALLGLITVAEAQGRDISMADGSVWRLENAALTRTSPAISATLDVYTIGVDCTAGMTPTVATARPAYLPPSFHRLAIEEPDGAGTFATVCADIGGQVLIVRVRWKAPLLPADVVSIRTMLDFLYRGIQGGPPSGAQTVGLFRPAIVKVPLTAATGAWDFVKDVTTNTDTLLMHQWPATGTPIMVSLNRPPATQTCNTVGLPTPVRPPWAPAGFYANSATRDGMTVACFDAADGHLLLVTVKSTPGPGDGATRALLEAIAATLGAAPQTAALAPAAAPTSSTPYAPSDTTSSDDSSSSRSGYRGGTPRWRLGVSRVQVAAAGTEAQREAYTASLGYLHVRRFELDTFAYVPEVEAGGVVGISGDADLAFDIHAGGSFGFGSEKLTLFGTAGLGADGYGLGSDEADAVPRLGSDFYGYFGLKLRIRFSYAAMLDGYLIKASRNGPVDETRYGAELTVRRPRMAFAFGVGYTDYEGTAKALGATLGIRR